MLLLGIKIFLTPLLVGLVSLAGRKWGPSVSGWLAGLPLTSGPIALYLAIERGTSFAAGAAGGTLAGLISAGAFCLVYFQLSFKVHWFGCLLGGWAGYLVATVIFQEITPPLVVTYFLVIGFLALATWLMSVGKNRNQTGEAERKIVAPKYELLWRMLIATVFVVSLTASADFLGARLSGLLAPFPIFASILAAFTHHLQGPKPARILLQNTVIGAFTFATFFLCFGSLVEPGGPAVAFMASIAVGIVTQGCSFLVIRYTRHRQLAANPPML